MRVGLTAMTALLLIAIAGTAVGGDIHYEPDWDDKDCVFENHAVQVDKQTLFLTAVEHEDFEVEITPDYDLYVDGNRVELNDEQKRLVQDYYDLLFEIAYHAHDIKWEGAKIGMKGAGVGVKAIGGLVKMLFTSYDEDEFERDIERAAEKIEKEAEKLEDRAETLENMAYDLQDRFDVMIGGIPALQELDW